jgi:protein-S-isoprenylcysteine O-methyltransferase Ste14
MKNLLFNYLTIIAVLVVSSILMVQRFNSDNSFDLFAYGGLLLMVPSLILFTIARIQLGSSFQISAEANKLVTTGIYKKIRHPIYFSGLIFILGYIIFMKQFYMIIILLGLIILQKKRIKNEEKILEEKFGDEYVKYKRSTWF